MDEYFRMRFYFWRTFQIIKVSNVISFDGNLFIVIQDDLFFLLIGTVEPWLFFFIFSLFLSPVMVFNDEVEGAVCENQFFTKFVKMNMKSHEYGEY